MSITSDLSKDLFNIQLTPAEVDQLHTLVIDFFAAAYAGFLQNRTFNEAVEKVMLPMGGAEESTVLF